MIPRVIHGNCLEVLPGLNEQFDACITDPPYHLTSIVKRFGFEGSAPAQFGTDGAFARASRGFMGKQWDGGDIAFRPETWRLVWDVLKPGAHLAAFGGTRTFHRMAVAIEDAGFEIRDTLSWLYGTGFPKSHNLKDDWAGWGTALKPAFEPIILARKPLVGTVAANVLAHGTGAINIDACRVPTDETIHTTRNVALGSSSGGVYGAATVPGVFEGHAAGRWPANVLHDGSEEVEAAFAAFNAPGQQGRARTDGMAQGNNTYGALRHITTSPEPRGDTGTASRFFYCAKASKADRAGSKHPTVKPLALLRWLVTLVTPPGGSILDPFAGSGTTLQAAYECGFSSTGIELEADYFADMTSRLGNLQDVR